MMNLIKGYLRQRQIEQQLLRKAKFNEIKKATEKFYIDLEGTGTTSDIPYFLKAEEVLNEKIKCPSDIDYYYNRLIKWRLKCV